MRNNTAIRFLFDQLTNGQLQWNDVADDYDTVVLVDDKNQDAKSLEVIERHNKAETTLPSFQCSMLSGRERTIKEVSVRRPSPELPCVPLLILALSQLLKSFPSEEKAIRKYYDLLTEVRKAMRGFVGIKFMPKFLATLLIKTGLVNQYTTYFKLAEKTLTEVLDELTDNKTLKAVLAYNFGDYGTMPKDAPFVMHAVLVNHFLNGVSYPVGGSSEFAYHMFPIVEAAGGKAFVRAEVDEIVCNGSGAAVGVKLKKVKRQRGPPSTTTALVANTVLTCARPVVAGRNRHQGSHDHLQRGPVQHGRDAPAHCEPTQEHVRERRSKRRRRHLCLRGPQQVQC